MKITPLEISKQLGSKLQDVELMWRPRKHKLKTSFFSNIDTEEKAYVLGFIASDGHIARNRITIKIHKKDVDVLEKIREQLGSTAPITYCKKQPQVRMDFCSIQLAVDACKHLGVSPGKKSDSVKFPSMPFELYRHFIRGFFDGDGHVRKPDFKVEGWPYPLATICTTSANMRQSLSLCNPGKSTTYNFNIVWQGYEALLLLDWLYTNSKIHLERKKNLWLRWKGWQPAKETFCGSGDDGVLKWAKTHSKAFAPTLVGDGYEIEVVAKSDDGFYETCLKLKPAETGNFHIVASHELKQAGYVLVDHLVVDESLISPIRVKLKKFDVCKPNLPLPFNALKLLRSAV